MIDFFMKIIDRFLGFIVKSLMNMVSKILGSIAKTIIVGFLKMIVSAKKSNFVMFYTPVALFFIGYYNSLIYLAVAALVVWMSMLFIKGLN